jgi:hypothetical protein
MDAQTGAPPPTQLTLNERLLIIVEAIFPRILIELWPYAAVWFRNTSTDQQIVLTTPSVNTPPATSNYFLLSFWYNATSPQNVVMFKAPDPGGATVAELDFANNDFSLTLQVDNQGSFSTITFVSPTTGQEGSVIPHPVRSDGKWHDLIVNAHMTGACLTDDTQQCCLTAEYWTDAGNAKNVITSMAAVDSTGAQAGPSYASFGPFVWSNATSSTGTVG